MPVIDENTAGFLKNRFEKELNADVEVTVFSDRPDAGDPKAEYVDFTLTVFRQLAALSPKIRVTETGLSDPRAKLLSLSSNPTTVLGADKGLAVIFSGAPAGTEFQSLIDSLVRVSRSESGLSPESEARIAASTATGRSRVFVTLSCPKCPQMVMLSHGLAIASKGRIQSECVESEENIELSREFGVSAVPQVVVNSDKTSVLVDRRPEAEFVDHVLKHLEKTGVEV